MNEESLDRQEIIRLLGKLKEETPEYPSDLLESRKYSYLKQVLDLQISKSSPPGSGSTGGPGRPGAALRGGATFLGFPLKTLLAIGAAIALLAAGYLFQEQIVEFLADSGVIAAEETATPLIAPGGSEQETPDSEAPSTGTGATQPAPGTENEGPAGTPAPPGQRGPANVFEYLICVLQRNAESCR